MKKIALVALLLTGCAIPVRPIARVVPDTDGAMHFVPDEAQEPHVPAGLGQGFSMILTSLGPWGQLASALLAGSGLVAAGHAHGKKNKKKDKPADPVAPA